MFLKRLIRFTMIVTAVLFVLTACSPAPTSQAVDVPKVIELALGTLVLAVLTAGFVFLFEKTNLDLRGFALPISVAISAYLVAQLQGFINTIPAEYDPFLTVLFEIIAVIVGGLGVLRLRSNERARLL